MTIIRSFIGLSLIFAILKTTKTTMEQQQSRSRYPIPGDYSDPNHPNCKRNIAIQAVDGTFTTASLEVIKVSGTDGSPGCPPDGSGDAWTLQGTIDLDTSTIVVDFSPKGGPKNLKGRRDEVGILWEDNNLWKYLN